MRSAICHLASYASFGLGSLCFWLHHRIGGRLDADGFLREPFWLLPMGWFFAFSGLSLLIASLFRPKKEDRA
ncbi:MAG: DUF3955 domain-containing protein [Verrucomicrobia bacterium]|nr:DUF3955 domain-containing protein [Verrucomicrobiota bacterium]